MAGKGSDRRPMDDRYCTPDKYRNMWDNVFKKDTTPKESSDKKDKCEEKS